MRRQIAWDICQSAPVPLLFGLQLSMKLTRFQSLALAGGTLVLFFVLSVFLSPKSDLASKSSASQIPLPTPAADTTATSRFVLGTFERNETRDGKKLWEIKAQRGEYFPESNSASVEEATLTLYRENKPVELKAARATITLTGTSLHRADLAGGVKMVYLDQNVTVETSDAMIDMTENRVSAPGSVSVNGPDFEMHGNKFEGDLKTHNFRLTERVTTILRPRSGQR